MRVAVWLLPPRPFPITSARENVTHILDRRAPDDAVIRAGPSCAKTQRNTVTRRKVALRHSELRVRRT